MEIHPGKPHPPMVYSEPLEVHAAEMLGGQMAQPESDSSGSSELGESVGLPEQGGPAMEECHWEGQQSGQESSDGYSDMPLLEPIDEPDAESEEASDNGESSSETDVWSASTPGAKGLEIRGSEDRSEDAHRPDI